jgi:hypothetical protein
MSSGSAGPSATMLTSSTSRPTQSRTKLWPRKSLRITEAGDSAEERRHETRSTRPAIRRRGAEPTASEQAARYDTVLAQRCRRRAGTCLTISSYPRVGWLTISYLDPASALLSRRTFSLTTLATNGCSISRQSSAWSRRGRPHRHGAGRAGRIAATRWERGDTACWRPTRHGVAGRCPRPGRDRSQARSPRGIDCIGAKVAHQSVEWCPDRNVGCNCSEFDKGARGAPFSVSGPVPGAWCWRVE